MDQNVSYYLIKDKILKEKMHNLGASYLHLCVLISNRCTAVSIAFVMVRENFLSQFVTDSPVPKANIHTSGNAISGCLFVQFNCRSQLI